MAITENERHKILKHTLFFRNFDREEVHKMQQFFQEQALKCPKGAFVATRIDGFGQDSVYYETRLVTTETELVKAQEFLNPIGEMIEKMSPMVKASPTVKDSMVITSSDPSRHSVSITTNDSEVSYWFQKQFEKWLLEFFRKYPEIDDRRKFFIEVEVDGSSHRVALKTRPGILSNESLEFLSRLEGKVTGMRGKFAHELMQKKND